MGATMSDKSPISEGLDDPGQRYETLRMIQSALRNGWQIPDAWKSTLPVEVYRIVEDPSLGPRERLRAIETVVAMDAKNTEKLLALEKSVRLGGANATEAVVFPQLEF